MSRFEALKATIRRKTSKISYWEENSETKFPFDFYNSFLTAELRTNGDGAESLLITDDFPRTFEDEYDLKALEAVAFLLNDDSVLHDFEIVEESPKIAFAIPNQERVNGEVSRAVIDRLDEMIEDISITEANLASTGQASRNVLLVSLSNARTGLASAKELMS